MHDAFQEWLPVLLGNNGNANVNPLGLQPGNSRSKQYSLDTTAAISNEFAAAAFRVGHTLVSNMILTPTAELLKTLYPRFSPSYRNPRQVQRSCKCRHD